MYSTPSGVPISMFTDARISMPGKFAFINFAIIGEVVVTELSPKRSDNSEMQSPTDW